MESGCSKTSDNCELLAAAAGNQSEIKATSPNSSQAPINFPNFPNTSTSPCQNGVCSLGTWKPSPLN